MCLSVPVVQQEVEDPCADSGGDSDYDDSEGTIGY